MRGDERDIRAVPERAPNQTGDYPHREISGSGLL